jgi:hypothetical protein
MIRFSDHAAVDLVLNREPAGVFCLPGEFSSVWCLSGGCAVLPQRHMKFDLAGSGDEPSGNRNCARFASG